VLEATPHRPAPAEERRQRDTLSPQGRTTIRPLRITIRPLGATIPPSGAMIPPLRALIPTSAPVAILEGKDNL